MEDFFIFYTLQSLYLLKNSNIYNNKNKEKSLIFLTKKIIKKLNTNKIYLSKFCLIKHPVANRIRELADIIGCFNLVTHFFLTPLTHFLVIHLVHWFGGIFFLSFS